MTIHFKISTLLPASAKEVYKAWLDAGEHSKMIGTKAVISGEVDADFSMWDGYITGKNLALEPWKRIVQSWRTTEFSEDDPDSLVEIVIESTLDGAKLTLNHSKLPDHGMQYKQGWVENYFEPMKIFFKSI
jgi:activator of HSP90 ATPase